ncbi:hypothetical protein HZC00_02370 [Candidatus Kaiserbacteria bacterium]|nr:hypothetical protein [Candidatus Kaiserbacteria bacterium]
MEYKEGTDGKQPLSPALEKINQDMASILIPKEHADSWDVTLGAVGKRYVVVTIARPTGAGSSDQILDSVTLKSNYVDGLFQFVVGKTAVYVSGTDICAYTLDQPSCVALPGAKLSGDEVYGDAGGLAGYFEPQGLTHTNTTLTIDILKWVPDQETGYSKLQKARDVMLKLPASKLEVSLSTLPEKCQNTGDNDPVSIDSKITSQDGLVVGYSGQNTICIIDTVAGNVEYYRLSGAGAISISRDGSKIFYNYPAYFKDDASGPPDPEAGLHKIERSTGKDTFVTKGMYVLWDGIDGNKHGPILLSGFSDRHSPQIIDVPHRLLVDVEGFFSKNEVQIVVRRLPQGTGAWDYLAESDIEKLPILAKTNVVEPAFFDSPYLDALHRSTRKILC